MWIHPSAWSAPIMETNPTPTLYDRLGGAGAIDAALRLFYEKILADPMVAPFFARTNVNRLIAQQRNFIGSAIGGPQGYRGPDMRTPHPRDALQGPPLPPGAT